MIKQHVTLQQLNQLSDKAKTDLLSWCHNRELYAWKRNEDGTFTVDNEKIPQLSIGQLLWFLYEKGETSLQDMQPILYLVTGRTDNGINPETFCDDLWKQVKTLLTN